MGGQEDSEAEEDNCEAMDTVPAAFTMSPARNGGVQRATPGRVPKNSARAPTLSAIIRPQEFIGESIAFVVETLTQALAGQTSALKVMTRLLQWDDGGGWDGGGQSVQTGFEIRTSAAGRQCVRRHVAGDTL